MNDAQKIGASIAGLFAACAIAAPLVSSSEGIVNTPYLDPANIVTVCGGHTGNDIVRGKRYSDQECSELLGGDLYKHAVLVARCVPTDALPTKTYASFISFTFNVGDKFCDSTLAKKARAGDLIGACNELPRWVKARTPQGLKVLPGLEIRRAKEKALCLEGVADLRPRQGVST